MQQNYQMHCLPYRSNNSGGSVGSNKKELHNGEYINLYSQKGVCPARLPFAGLMLAKKVGRLTRWPASGTKINKKRLLFKTWYSNREAGRELAWLCHEHFCN